MQLLNAGRNQEMVDGYYSSPLQILRLPQAKST
jgi:hypothetical protein